MARTTFPPVFGSSNITCLTAHCLSRFLFADARLLLLGPESTKPHATQAEQLEAITKFGQLLYLQKEVETAEYTYVARDFINHAPEVPGNGRALAIETLVPMLKTSTVEIKNVYAGARNATGSEFSVTYFKGNSSIFGVGVIADIWRMIGTCKCHCLLFFLCGCCSHWVQYR